MHILETMGTIMTVLFVAISVIFIKLFWFDAIAPFWVALIGTIALGGASIWACWKVGKFWCRKIKEMKGRK